MGQNALTLAATSTSTWNAAAYASAGAFVARLGEPVVDLLDPRPGERILDVGCGDGVLTARIIERGAAVIGVDNSAELAAEARRRGIEVVESDAGDMSFENAFDAAFSNAALHWMLDKQRVAAAIFRALKPGARFVGEMGGEGNVERLRGALDAELVERGYRPPAESTNWYPAPDEFTAVYRSAGFAAIEAWLIERPTPLDEGAAGWVTTFRAGWLDRAGAPRTEWPEIAAATARRFGSDTADYVRLRFIMRKPV